MSRPNAWWSLFGKPDGTFIRLRCAILGHQWWLCDEECCGSECEWCERCLGKRIPTPIVKPDRAMP